MWCEDKSERRRGNAWTISIRETESLPETAQGRRFSHVIPAAFFSCRPTGAQQRTAAGKEEWRGRRGAPCTHGSAMTSCRFRASSADQRQKEAASSGNKGKKRLSQNASPASRTACNPSLSLTKGRSDARNEVPNLFTFLRRTNSARIVRSPRGVYANPPLNALHLRSRLFPLHGSESGSRGAAKATTVRSHHLRHPPLRIRVVRSLRADRLAQAVSIRRSRFTSEFRLDYGGRRRGGIEL